MIRVLICDDQEIVCEGLQHILNSDDDIKVVGVAHNGVEALEQLMDLKMPVMNGVIATRAIAEKYPSTKILILTTFNDDDWVFEAIRSGASGYLLKDRPRQELIKAIKGTVRGEAYVDPAVAGKLLSSVAQGFPRQPAQVTIDLSDREKEVMQLLATGMSNAEIAKQLFLSEGTVRNYTSAIFSKLGVSDRTSAVVLAIKLGLVSIN